MGDLPIHQCEWDSPDGPLPVVTPMSVLDCPRAECRRRAAMARRGCYFDVEYIDQALERAETEVRGAMDTVALWQLIREAKERSLHEH